MQAALANPPRAAQCCSRSKSSSSSSSSSGSRQPPSSHTWTASQAPPRRQPQQPRMSAASGGSGGGTASPTHAPEPAAPLPPYYQLSLPVYSLATVGPGGASPTMNLVTYAAPISLKPRHYALGLYLNTLSWENMLATRMGVLQLLGEQHAALFELLGRTSGRDTDKLAELAQRGVPVSRRDKDGIPLLGDSLGWMELRFAAEPVNYGDHDVVICEVTDWHTPAAGAGGEGGAPRPLYTGHLRQLGLLP